jgi:hypothetical protein
MRLAIVGSRKFNNYFLLKEELRKYKEEIKLIVSGGAKGADTLGEKWANENNIPTLIFLADWNRNGKQAGFIRNEDIIKNCDNVVAFWDGVSKGTAHSLFLAKKYGKPIKIIYI